MMSDSKYFTLKSGIRFSSSTMSSFWNVNFAIWLSAKVFFVLNKSFSFHLSGRRFGESCEPVLRSNAGSPSGWFSRRLCHEGRRDASDSKQRAVVSAERDYALQTHDCDCEQMILAFDVFAIAAVLIVGCCRSQCFRWINFTYDEAKLLSLN